MDKIEYWTNLKDEEFKIVNGKIELDNIEIDGNLDLRFCTSLKSLTDNLTVRGNLDIYGCRSLNSLADNLNVHGYLDLEFCTSLKLLPDNLNVGGYLDLKGCISLVSLPDNLNVDGYLDLKGCTSLKHIGKNTLFHEIYFDEYSIHLEYNYIRLYQEIPISIKQSFIGKRVIDLIDDPRIYGTRYAEAIITILYDDGDFGIHIEG